MMTGLGSVGGCQLDWLVDWVMYGFKSFASFLRLSSRCTFLRFVHNRLPGRLLVEWFGLGMVQTGSLDWMGGFELTRVNDSLIRAKSASCRL